MSKVLRIDEDSIQAALLYSTDVSEAIRLMDKQIKDKLIHTTKEEIQFVVREEVALQLRREIEKLKEGIRNTNAEFMKYLSSGQGAIKLPEVKGDTFIGKEGFGTSAGTEFRRASLREEK